MGASTHYGTVAVDAHEGILTFATESAAFPIGNGSVQKPKYALKNGVLSYQVPPRSDGGIPVSVWRKLD